jgi:hypothetical protein
MADELRVVITADASGVGPGVAEATAAVTASADQIAAAQAKATAATKVLTDAQIKLGAAAEAGNAQAASIIAEYAAASTAATQAVESLTASQVENTAATVADTGAQAADTAATYSHAEAMGAAKVSMGAMTGSSHMMEMGLAKLAAGSSTLGPLLAKMIPVAVMAAGVFILYDLVQGMEAFGDKAQELGTDLGTGWLEGAILQLQGFGKEVEARQKDIDNLITDMDAERAKQGELSFAATGRAGGPTAEATARAQDIQGQIEGDRGLIEAQKILLDQDREQARLAAAAAASFSDRNSNIPNAGTAMANALAAAALAQQKVTDTEDRIAALAAHIATLQAEAQKIVVTMPPPPADKSEKGAKGTTDNLPEQIARAQIEAAHAADAELVPQARIVEEMNKQIALNDLKAKTSKEGTAAERETLRVIEDQMAADKAFAALDKLAADEKKKADEDTKKQQDEALKQQDEDLKAVDDGLVKQHKAEVDAARDKAELAIQSAALDFELSEAKIRRAEEEGRISHQTSEQELQDALRIKQQQTAAARQEEMGALKPGAFEDDERAYKKMQDQMTLDAKKAALERERITEQETKKSEQLYKKVANEFNQDFTRAFNEWATKSQTASQAFGRMLGQMELQVIDFVAKWLLEKAEMWAMDKIFQDNAQASSVAKNTVANTQKIISDAAVGAAGAEAAAAPAGPEAMAAAGAVATVLIMSNLSTVTMDTGGMLPHMGFAFNQSGSAERVLSPSQTSNFESMVNNGGSRAAHLHQTNNFNGGVTKEMLEAHTAATMNKLRGMLRPEAFA